jgi:hypothetical protein
MGREHPVIDKADLLIGTGWEQHQRHRHWPAALAMAVGLLLALRIAFLVLEQYSAARTVQRREGR